MSNRPASAFPVSNVKAGRLDSSTAVLPFFVSYILPVTFLATVRAAADGHIGILSNTWSCAWFVFCVLPILEIIVPDDLDNLTETDSKRASQDPRYKLPPWLWPVAQCPVLTVGAWAFCNLDFTRKSGRASPLGCVPEAWASSWRTSCYTNRVGSIEC